MTRAALWAALGVEIEVVAPMITDAYRREAERQWRGEEGWDATAFYVSSYPDEESCDRAAVYGLMGIPQDKPMDVTGQRWVKAGKALEMDFITALAREGMLLSGDESKGEKQTKFTEPHVWSSGAVDAIVLPPFWRKSLVVEVKNTGAEKMAAMRADKNNTIFSHRKYERQIKAYIGYAHELPFAPEVDVCKTSWAICEPIFGGLLRCPVHGGVDCETEHFQVEPPDSGELIYASRDPQRGNDLDVISYFYSYDPEFLRAGRERMARWRQSFLDGVLPPHVHQGKRSMWTPSPCKWCPVKAGVCKPDYNDKVTTLAESHAEEFARKIRPDYSYEQVRANVFARWEEEDPLLEERSEAA